MKQLILFLFFTSTINTSFIRPKNTVYQEPKLIKLELPVNDVDVVLVGLSKLPYEQSAQLINKIVTQTQAQLQQVKADTTKPVKKN